MVGYKMRDDLTENTQNIHAPFSVQSSVTHFRCLLHNSKIIHTTIMFSFPCLLSFFFIDPR